MEAVYAYTLEEMISSAGGGNRNNLRWSLISS